MHVGEHLARFDRLTALRTADDADRVVDRVLLRAPPAAELEARDPDRKRGEPRHDAGVRSHDLTDDGSARERIEVGIAALRADPLLVLLARRAVGHRLPRTLAALVHVDAQIGQGEKAGAGVENELHEVRRALARDRVHRLSHLERVADGRAEGLIHVGQQAHDGAFRPASEVDHLLGEDAPVVERLHERAVADLDVEHHRLRARSELLRHDRRRDERDDVHRRGDVAKRVELLVGGNEIARLTDDRDADLTHLLDELVDRQLDAEAWDRLELVEGAARVPEPAPGHLPERDAARGDDRADGERGLVPHPSGRVLVDDAPPERGGEIERLAGADHRVRERVRLASREPLEVDGHAPSRHLVVGNVAARVAEDELGQLLVGELVAVPLALDQICCANHVSLSAISERRLLAE